MREDRMKIKVIETQEPVTELKFALVAIKQSMKEKYPNVRWSKVQVYAGECAGEYIARF